MIPTVSATLFLASAIAMHLMHRRIASSYPDLAEPAGRVLLELTPSTQLSRELTRGQLDHPLSGAYRFSWYVHLASGLVFAVSLMVNAFIALR